MKAVFMVHFLDTKSVGGKRNKSGNQASLCELLKLPCDSLISASHESTDKN